MSISEKKGLQGQTKKKDYKVFLLNLTQEQKTMLTKIANDMGLDLSNTMRFIIRKEYEKLFGEQKVDRV